jgi:ferredoxin--NADP+ reductase
VDDPQKKVEDVIIVARRGPFEAKFDKKEFKDIEMYLDREAFAQELQRIGPQLAAVGQDPATLADATFPVLAKPATAPTRARLLFRFLSSPHSIHSGPDGRISRLTVTENILVERDGDVAAKATSNTAELDVDTMIFAIGDVADPSLGLPYASSGYVTNADPADPKRAAYEVFDPQRTAVLDGSYVVGWARKASEGLVGIARHDGEQGAAHILKYLENAPEANTASFEHILSSLQNKGLSVVLKSDLEYLARAEELRARQSGQTWFKFSDDAAMLAAIEEHKKLSESVSGQTVG